MCVCARLLLLAALPALAECRVLCVAGRAAWCAGGEVVAVTEGHGAGGPAGARGPSFAPRQPTTVIAAAGQAASLDCRVRNLGDKSVSWVRSRDLQILSHAGTVFTADARVSATGPRGGAGAHSLRLARLREADGGRYECQVNTEPKMSLFFNLTVLDEPVPAVVVRALGDAGAGGAVHARAGDAATLACEARYEPAPRALPLPPLEVRWRRAEDHAPLALQSARGGVSMDTTRWAARVESRVTLAGLRAADSGAYECAVEPVGAVGTVAPTGTAGTTGRARATLRLLVDAEEHMEMQRDQSAGAGRAGGSALLPLALPLALLAARAGGTALLTTGRAGVGAL